MNDYSNYKHSELTEEIINAAYEVHNYLGFGFLESVYENALKFELEERGFKVTKQEEVEVYFKTKMVGHFKADLIVDDRVIIELKAVSQINPRHEVQLVNYLRATKIEVGLVVNFGEKLKVKRRVFSNERKRSLTSKR